MYVILSLYLSYLHIAYWLIYCSVKVFFVDDSHLIYTVLIQDHYYTILLLMVHRKELEDMDIFKTKNTLRTYNPVSWKSIQHERKWKNEHILNIEPSIMKEWSCNSSLHIKLSVNLKYHIYCICPLESVINIETTQILFFNTIRNQKSNVLI